MKSKEVLIIGAGVAGCLTALALAKRGVAVALLGSPSGAHSLFLSRSELDTALRTLADARDETLCCPRAFEQFSTLANASLDNLLLKLECIEKNGYIDVLHTLKEALSHTSAVEWLSDYEAMDLLTLERHSKKSGDRIKKPTCIGAIACHRETRQAEYFLAKETILATGGALSLFPYSFYGEEQCGSGLAMAGRSGARLLDMGGVSFHPLALYHPSRPCYPLPLELLKLGGKLTTLQGTPLEAAAMTEGELLRAMYDAMTARGQAHLWLDLTAVDGTALKETAPPLDDLFLSYGFNRIKELLPVVPAAARGTGGIAVDKVAETQLQRLRAVGSVACTGLSWKKTTGALLFLEAAVFATSCADDIAKAIHKFVYYFPDICEERHRWEAHPQCALREEWTLLRQIMWAYAGIRRTLARLKTAASLLEALQKSVAEETPSFEQWRLTEALRVAQMMIQVPENKHVI